MQGAGEQRPIGELLSELAAETGALVRNEVDLAKVELTGKAQVASRNAIQCGIGAAVTLLGAAAVLAAIILVLARVMPAWLSALVVGAVVCAVGGALVRRGVRSFEGLDLMPRETVRSIEGTKQWATDEVTR